MSLKRFFSPRAQPVGASLALLLLRVTVGVAFILHGWTKIQAPFGWTKMEIPAVFQFLAAISEFGGGIAWVLGLVVPLASLGIGFTMAVAVPTVVFAFHGMFVNPKGGASAELPATYLCVALLILATGPGKFSLDQKLFGERA